MLFSLKSKSAEPNTFDKKYEPEPMHPWRPDCKHKVTRETDCPIYRTCSVCGELTKGNQ